MLEIACMVLGAFGFGGFIGHRLGVRDSLGLSQRTAGIVLATMDRDNQSKALENERKRDFFKWKKPDADDSNDPRARRKAREMVIEVEGN